MDYTLIDKEYQSWFGYAPRDPQYIRYAKSNPGVIAAGHKIDDVYYAFACACQSFINAGANDLGDVCDPDDFSMLFAKSHFLTCAIFEYSLCQDISWQVVLAYVQTTTLEGLVKQTCKQEEGKCTYKYLTGCLAKCLEKQLSSQECIIVNKLKDAVEKFSEDTDVRHLRDLCNSLKHRGMIHIEGLGCAQSHLNVIYNKVEIPILCRESFKIEELENLLLSYHLKFIEYFNSIIQTIMPDDYKDNNTDLLAPALMREMSRYVPSANYSQPCILGPEEQ